MRLLPSRPWRVCATALAVCIAAGGPAASGNPSTNGQADDQSATIERDASDLRALVVDNGPALELIWDGTEYVMVMPAGSPGIDEDAWGELSLLANVRVQAAAVSQADIDAVMARIAELAHEERRSYVTFFDGYSGKVVVEGPISARAQVMKEFPGIVEYVPTDEIYEPQAGRNADREPFSGGAWLTDNRFFPDVGRTCTSGFALKKNNIEYMVTAGHCKELGAVLWTKDGATFGAVKFRRHGHLKIDAALLGDYDYGTKIYDENNLGGTAFVDSGGNPAVGASYCTSGAVSWLKCNKVVEATNVQACDANGNCTVGLVRYTHGDGATKDGDSGGPFFFKYNANCVAARGTIVGIAGQKGYSQMWNGIANEFAGAIIVHDCFGT
jgi:hypothetical protein